MKTVEDLRTEMERQYMLLLDECQRVKAFVNSNGFDVTTAPYTIVRRYRLELKEQLNLLRDNLSDLDR